MNASPKRSAPPSGSRTGQVFMLQAKTTTPRNPEQVDVFAEARLTYSIPQVWTALGFAGEAKPHGMHLSPFRDERTASLSIFDDGTAWKDWGTGEGGDVIEFVRVALGGWPEARSWFAERLRMELHSRRERKTPSRPAKPTPAAPAVSTVTEWPGELVEGKEETWGAFAGKRGITPLAASAMVASGLVRFLKIDGKACYVVTDESRRNAEIRRFDGAKFGDSKAFPLKMYPGAKSWPVGCDLLRGAPKNAGVFLCEGATDFISAIGLLARYRKAGGQARWMPLGLLGAHCKALAPDAAELIRGRRARIAFDADKAGEEGAAHWRKLLLGLGCTVDTVELEAGNDLTDVAADIEPETLFSL